MLKNRLLYILFLGAATTFSYFYPGPVSSTLFYSVLLIPAASLIYTLYIYSRFCYLQSVDKKFVTKGDKVHFNVEIVNETIMIYPYVEILFYGIDTVFTKHFKAKKTAVLPKSRGCYQFSLECQYRGYYEMGLKEIRIKDFLGFFSFKYKVREPKYITVYPRIAILETFPVHSHKLSDIEGQLMGKEEDKMITSDIRKYAYGDSIKRIHWKLSAKKDEMMVKNYDSTATMGATIVLDLTQNNYGILENTILEDKVIEATVAILHYCLLRHMETHLVYYDGNGLDRKIGSEYSDFEGFYHLLFKIQFEGSIAFDETIKMVLNEEQEKNSIILITSNLDEHIYSEISAWREINDEIILVYVSPQQIASADEFSEGEMNEILLALQEMNVKTYKIDMSEDIKYILEC